MADKVIQYTDTNGRCLVVSDDKRQMARWYALDYLVDKPIRRSDGLYVGSVSEGFTFAPGFRKRKT